MVTLYVDGVTYEPYLVTDDWPIHPSQIDVQLTVGACWQGEWPGGDALLLWSGSDEAARRRRASVATEAQPGRLMMLLSAVATPPHALSPPVPDRSFCLRED